MSRNWNTSRELFERARRSLAGGVSSPVRAKAPVPLYFTSGRGSRLTDVDGNEYIDYQLGWGPNILGYNHPWMVAAMQRQVGLVHNLGAQHELEIQVAELIQAAVPCAERVAFTSSGTEAVQLAHRLARAFTGRPLILKFEGHYHGWVDTALHSHHPSMEEMGPIENPHVVPGSRGQVSNAADNVVVAPWNRIDVLERLLDRHAGKVAAVIMEPVLCNSGCLMPRPGYLQAVRELTRKHGTLLIFDEVITGFRIALGGAQSHFGVTPDCATFGKAVGGGVPLSVVAGRREILEQMFTSGVVFGGSFNGNPMSLAGASACLKELSRDGGAALAHANRMGEKIRTGLRELAARYAIPLQVTGFGAAFSLHFTTREDLVEYRDTLADDTGRLQRFLLRAMEEGVILVPDGRMYVSAVHTERDIEETLAAFARIFAKP
ncbi:MAG: aspartate aminotransferase family protein [Acidobacteriales bacterium]|nr:aspartate aminotransferase family protein [Terriglobales bacterium]